MKNNKRRLSLHKQTLVTLTKEELKSAVGGVTLFNWCDTLGCSKGCPLKTQVPYCQPEPIVVE
jgi:hypothetical protein